MADPMREGRGWINMWACLVPSLGSWRESITPQLGLAAHLQAYFPALQVALGVQILGRKPHILCKDADMFLRGELVRAYILMTSQFFFPDVIVMLKSTSLILNCTK